MQRAVIYRVRIRGQLGPQWSAWFGGLEVESRPDGDTTLTGRLDQAALHGLLARLRDLGLAIVSMETLEGEEATR